MAKSVVTWGYSVSSDLKIFSSEQQMEAEIHRLREENGRLRLHLRVLQRQMDEGEELSRQICRQPRTEPSNNDVTTKIAEIQAELVTSREAISGEFLSDDKAHLACKFDCFPKWSSRLNELCLARA